MSKRGYISRYMLILKKLKVKPYSSYEELLEYIDNQMEYLQMQDDKLTVGFSQRTLQRDIKEIRNLFGIGVEFSNSRKGYYIVQNEHENMNFQRMMEAFDVFNALNLTQNVRQYISFDNRVPVGTGHLYGLLYAIKNHFLIRFTYSTFWGDTTKTLVAEPYLLKEFKGRWYILAVVESYNEIRTFALDRLTNLQTTADRFIKKEIDAPNLFKDSFGIMLGEGNPAEEVTLRFSHFQGKYIKSLPLHSSQEILKDEPEGLTIKLKVHITFDFIMEIRSYGETVEVISPKSLRQAIRSSFEEALTYYSL
jgi:predicted DNA-binding transcriptional regulator YafY